MKYYIDIDVKSSTTKLGELLTAEVVNRYGMALVSKKQAENIPGWLEQKIAELCNENKRLKPMKVKVSGVFTGNVTIYVVTEKGAKAFEDNRPFTMYLRKVARDHTTNPALLREYSSPEILGAAFDSLKDARYSIFTALGTVEALDDNNVLRETAEAIERAIVEIGAAATKTKKDGTAARSADD